MQLGFNLPISGPMSHPRSFARLAQEGEAMGYDYLTLTDHVVLPDLSVPGYPYSESGEFIANTPTERHELLTAAAFIAAKTSRIRLVLAVLVVPHRPAVLAAKMLSTIDVLSEGRLVVGIGAGWLKPEFDAVVTTPFAERGAVTDEYLAAFRALWTEPNAKFDGRYTKFADLVFLPRPVQQPHPPLWVGGESGPALRRAARLGDGWYPIGVNPRFPLDTLTRYRDAVQRLRALASEAGRDPSKITLAYRCARHGSAVEPRLVNGERRLFAGSAAEIAEDLRTLRDFGVTAVDFSLAGPTLEASLDRMKRFRDEVMALV